MNDATDGSKLGATDPHVLEVIRVAKLQLDALMQQRAGIMRKIASARQTIAGLMSIFGSTFLDSELLQIVDHRTTNRQPGFTRACRLVLMEANQPLSSAEICAELRSRFPDLASRHKDLPASVTTVLSRLASYGEARPAQGAAVKKLWEWIPDREPGLLTPNMNGLNSAVQVSPPGIGAKFA